VLRGYQGVENGFAQKIAEVDVESFGIAGVFFDPEVYSC